MVYWSCDEQFNTDTARIHKYSYAQEYVFTGNNNQTEVLNDEFEINYGNDDFFLSDDAQRLDSTCRALDGMSASDDSY